MLEKNQGKNYADPTLRFMKLMRIQLRGSGLRFDVHRDPDPSGSFEGKSKYGSWLKIH